MKITLKFSVVLILLASVIFSCSKKEDFTEAEQQVVALENGLNFRKASLLNQEITFSLIDNDGNDISAEATFYVNNEALQSNLFTSSTEGEFEIYAEFLQNGTQVQTETNTFSVITPTRKVTVEDYTGTWCGFCPAVNAAIKEVTSQTPHITTVAIHNGDQFALDIEPAIRAGLNVPSGSPRGRIDRTIVWGSGFVFPPEVVMDYVGGPSNYGISINSQVNNRTLVGQITVAATEAIESKKLVVYLTEDGLLDDQTNYFNNDPDSPFYNLGDPIVDFQLDHVLRAVIGNDILGDPIPSTAALTDYVFNFNYEIPNNFVIDNLDIVVMVVDQDNLALNSQHASVGAFKPFE